MANKPKRYEDKVKANLKNPGMFAPVKTMCAREYEQIKRRESRNQKPFIPRFS